MIRAQDAVDRVQDFLANRISLEDFEDWSASYIHDVHRSEDVQAQKSAHLIRSILNAFEDDETEQGLRQELANAVRPFAQLVEIVPYTPVLVSPGKSSVKPLMKPLNATSSPVKELGRLKVAA